MVVVSLHHRELSRLLGKRVSKGLLQERLPMMGAALEGVEDDTIKVEISPNRPDLYSVEGVTRALKGVLDMEVGLPKYHVGDGGIDFQVDKNVKAVRPYLVGGLVKGLTLTDEVVVSLVELQERLHASLGRGRKKVAVGLHDYDQVEPPFVYRAFGPHEVSFVPLGGSEEMTLGDILTNHEKGREYGWILQGKERLPLILDNQDRVLSFPPIINGNTTTLTPETTNILIDVTGTDLMAVSKALDIMMTAMADRGGEMLSVSVHHPNGILTTPDLTPIRIKVSVAGIRELLSSELPPEDMVAALERMRFGARHKGGALEVEIPAYRTDILHEVDLMEDVAIGHGFDRFQDELPKRLTFGRSNALNQFTQALRHVVVGHGLQEVRTLTFQDQQAPFTPRETPLRLRNPITSELNVVRSTLLPSLLDILRLNRHRELPQRFFEIDDVVLEGINRRHLGGVIIHSKAGFTEVKGLVQGILRDIGLSVEVTDLRDENFLQGRCARPIVEGEGLGLLGELTPEIITRYELFNPVAAFELDVQTLLDALRGREPS